MVEILVSVAIFTVVMLVALGALLSILGANKKAQALKTAINNMNFAMESMTRTIRTGFDYSCDAAPETECAGGSGSTDMYLTNSDNLPVVFRLNNNRIERQVNGAAFVPLTSPDITIGNLQFFVDGVVEDDEIQPRVLILLTGTAGVSATASTTFTMQTLVTQRLIDR